MKKTVLIVLLACAVYTGAFAQQSLYVSANGNNKNDGLSERKALRSLVVAYEKACAGHIKKITVIGTLDYKSEEVKDGSAIFILQAPDGIENEAEILITGKPDAKGKDRAVLSGIGSKKTVVSVFGTTRLEHIEISGGELDAEKAGGAGISFVVCRGILGPSTVVRANKGEGVYVSLLGDCILAGGEIRDNEYCGVYIDSTGTFTMESGTIRNNKSPDEGGGVCAEGTFTMLGGTISGNRAEESGGGVSAGSTFTMSGGTISGNTAKEDGGGVFVWGKFTMSSGTISGNRADYGGGVAVYSDTFTMSGGTISGNAAKEEGGGVYISIATENGESVFSMTGGIITGNGADVGGGVCVSGVKEEFVKTMNGGIFKQTNGSITANKARLGGGVYVYHFNGRYDKTGGTVSNNTATQVSRNAPPGFTNDANVNRVQGSLGSGK